MSNRTSGRCPGHHVSRFELAVATNCFVEVIILLFGSFNFHLIVLPSLNFERSDQFCCLWVIKHLNSIFCGYRASQHFFRIQRQLRFHHWTSWYQICHKQAHYYCPLIHFLYHFNFLINLEQDCKSFSASSNLSKTKYRCLSSTLQLPVAGCLGSEIG